MSTPVDTFGSIERAVMALLVRDLAPLEHSDARVGGDFPREVDDFYVRIDRVSGRTDSFEGTFVIDLEVFSQDYNRAEKISGLIESIMLSHGYLGVIQDGRRWVFDDITQSVAPDDIPWEGDDDTYRFLSTYTFTARRRATSADSVLTPPPVPTPDTLDPGEAPIDPVLLFENAMI